MTTISNFFNFRNDTPNNQIYPLDKNPIIPIQAIPILKDLNINSLTEFYRFLKADPNNLALFGKLTNIYEDDLARLEEQAIQHLEKTHMITPRCGKTPDPCKTLPPYLIKK